MEWYQVWVGNDRETAIQVLVLGRNEPDAVVKLCRFISPLYIQGVNKYLNWDFSNN